MQRTMEMAETQREIYLTLLNGTGYLFNADDYLYLRRKYRIVGTLVGITDETSLSPTEDSPTMPVELSAFETCLLLDKGIAVLVSKEDEMQGTVVEMEQNEEAVEIVLQQRLGESEGNVEEVIASNCTKPSKCKISDEAAPHNDGVVIANGTESEVALEHPLVHTGRIAAGPAVDPIKYRVFCDFWQRGKYITGGDSFGADFLIYPGDPMMYHASHILILLDEPTIEPIKMIAKLRMSVVVNKYCIFAYAVPGAAGSEPELHYQTVLWDASRRDLNDLSNDKRNMFECFGDF